MRCSVVLLLLSCVPAHGVRHDAAILKQLSSVPITNNNINSNTPLDGSPVNGIRHQAATANHDTDMTPRRHDNDRGGSIRGLQATAVPSNDECRDAITLSAQSNQLAVQGSTVGATRESQDIECFDMPADAPGVWYAVEGHGGLAAASLCGSGTNYDTKIHVMANENECGLGSFLCIAANDDACDLKSSVTWPALSGVTYYVLVSGYDGDSGAFSLEMIRETEDLFVAFCDDPAALYDLVDYQSENLDCMCFPDSRVISCYPITNSECTSSSLSSCSCGGPNCFENRELFFFADPADSGSAVAESSIIEKTTCRQCFSDEDCTGFRQTCARVLFDADTGDAVRCVFSEVYDDNTVSELCTTCSLCTDEDGNEGLMYDCFGRNTKGICDTSSGSFAIHPFLGDSRAVEQQQEQLTSPPTLVPITALPTAGPTSVPTSEPTPAPTSTPTSEPTETSPAGSAAAITNVPSAPPLSSSSPSSAPSLRPSGASPTSVKISPDEQQASTPEDDDNSTIIVVVAIVAVAVIIGIIICVGVAIWWRREGRRQDDAVTAVAIDGEPRTPKEPITIVSYIEPQTPRQPTLQPANDVPIELQQNVKCQQVDVGGDDPDGGDDDIAPDESALGTTKPASDSSQTNDDATGGDGFVHIDVPAEPEPPIFYAVLNGDLEMVKQLVQQGADPNETDASGLSPLHLAAKVGYLDMVTYFIEICNMNANARDNNGYSPLHFAAQKGHLDIVKYFIETCGMDGNAKDNDKVGYTPLHLAAHFDRTEVVEYLIGRYGIDVDATTNNGDTPLHFAAYFGHFDTVFSLVTRGRANYAIENGRRNTPMDVALIERRTAENDDLEESYIRVVEFLDQYARDNPR